MLIPNKYTNIDISLLSISGEILKIFRDNNTITYSNLLNSVISKKGIESKSIFLPALSFLFLFGIIKYHKKEDIIEYCNEN
jgi:hypothetical protein